MKTTNAMNVTKGESELKKMEAIFGLLKPLDWWRDADVAYFIEIHFFVIDK